MPRAPGPERENVPGGRAVMSPGTGDTGREAHALARQLFPLCRSLTGSGVRATFDLIEEQIPIERTDIPSGTRVFDWIVPDEWNIRDAYIAAPDGSTVVDFRRSSLHVVSYSEPVRARLPLEELREHLHTLPDQPDLIPYRTSYYERTWGFCLSHRQLLDLEPGDYDVVIDSTLEPGHLSYAEHLIEGAGHGEVLISTYVCHPSLANDNLSGMVVATMLAKRLMRPAASVLVPLPVRPWNDRAARLAASEPRPARSDRARPDALVYRRWREPDLQAQPPRRCRHRPRGGDRACETRALRTGCFPGSPGAGTSASSARPVSTCRSAR